MKITEVKNRNKDLIDCLLEIWENTVRVTHLFLSNSEIENIKPYALQALNEVSHLLIIENEDNTPLGFMGINGTKLEMLFIKSDERKKGLGKELLLYGIKKYNINELTVNEQNLLAKNFYEHMGFKVYKRLNLDEQGRPYPILIMKL